jgi:hypothetical protein
VNRPYNLRSKGHNNVDVYWFLCLAYLWVRVAVFLELELGLDYDTYEISLSKRTIPVMQLSSSCIPTLEG